ncbi:MAG: hypothetical protein FWD57_17355 [Polyangiaceae bacterium]|nr:hypothetical protein [Polyangiaceae bacterium]
MPVDIKPDPLYALSHLLDPKRLPWDSSKDTDSEFTPHVDVTVRRASRMETVAVLHGASFMGHVALKRKFAKDPDIVGIRDVAVNLAYCVGLEGEPVGVASVQAWGRPMAQRMPVHGDPNLADDTELQNSRTSIHHTDDLFRAVLAETGSKCRVVHVFDRDLRCADALADLVQNGRTFVVAVRSVNRKHSEQCERFAKLIESVADTDVKSTQTIVVNQRIGTRHMHLVNPAAKRKRDKRGKAVPRVQTDDLSQTFLDTYCAELEFRAMKTDLSGVVEGASDILANTPLTIVRVREGGEYPGFVPVSWDLLTNLPAESEEDLAFVAHCYRQRFQAVEFHIELKAGCLSDRGIFEFGDGILGRLLSALTMAAQQERIKWFERERGDADASEVIDEDELQSLQSLLIQAGMSVSKRLTVQEAITAMKALGARVMKDKDFE